MSGRVFVSLAILVVIFTVSCFFLAFFFIVVLIGVCAHVGVLHGRGPVPFGPPATHRQRWEDWPPAVPPYAAAPSMLATLLLPHVTAAGPAL